MNVEPSNAVRLISPRLVALITTTNEDRSINASPYSWVFPFSFSPPMATVGVGRRGKNTQLNAEREAEFVINLVSEDFGQKACNLESKHGEWQLEKVGLNSADSQKLKTKGIKESVARIECRWLETVDVSKSDHVFLIGEIVAAECEAFSEGKPDLDKLGLLLHVSGREFRKVGEKLMLERKK